MHNELSPKLESALYVVATPIGNMNDISLRAIETLSHVDCIAAEDTRNTSRLLQHHHINTRLMAAHQHNERKISEKIITLIQAGQRIALVTDAGTPAVSDPGALIVEAVLQAGLRVIPIPGASAAITALSAGGLANPHFLFYGFLPNKSSARCNALRALTDYSFTLVFYEAPHRIIECSKDLCTIFGPDRQIVFGRELTKLFETIHRCPLSDAVNWLQSDSNQQRGEFVLLIEGVSPQQGLDTQSQQTLRLLLAELPVKQAVKLATQITGANRNELYQLALELKQNA